jgi:hypothetical protein
MTVIPEAPLANFHVEEYLELEELCPGPAAEVVAGFVGLHVVDEDYRSPLVRRGPSVNRHVEIEVHGIEEGVVPQADPATLRLSDEENAGQVFIIPVQRPIRFVHEDRDVALAAPLDVHEITLVDIIFGRRPARER